MLQINTGKIWAETQNVYSLESKLNFFLLFLVFLLIGNFVLFQEALIAAFIYHKFGASILSQIYLLCWSILQ